MFPLGLLENTVMWVTSRFSDTTEALIEEAIEVRNCLLICVSDDL